MVKVVVRAHVYRAGRWWGFSSLVGTVACFYIVSSTKPVVLHMQKCNKGVCCTYGHLHAPKTSGRNAKQ